MYCTLYASYPSLQTPNVLYTVCQLSCLTHSSCTVHCMPVILPYTHLMYYTLYASYPALQTPDVLYTLCQLSCLTNT